MNYASLLLLLLIVSTIVHPILSFAAWLSDTETSCMRDLAEGEIIMHHSVRSAVSSRYPEIHLQIFHDGELLNKDQTSSVINISSLVVGSLQIRLYIPVELRGSNLEFAMETTKGAKFISPNIGCDGRRASTRNKFDKFRLELTDENEDVHIWAGWATGMKPVTLTPRVTLTRSKGTTVNGEL
mmetsp:Transcript_45661/g.67380  ORF Transcript_45661/g.67380 Transcript_45661/m.67380 type:complete len:183 (+) Transcript_45661:3-551(+)